MKLLHKFGLVLVATLCSTPLYAQLVTDANVSYVGAFRIPAAAWLSFVNPDTAPLAYNAATNTLFMVGTSDAAGTPVAIEMTIPALTDIIDGSEDKLKFATLVQGPKDPTNGQMSQICPGGACDNRKIFGGLLVANGQLYLTAYIYYDANCAQAVSLGSRHLNLGDTSFSGWNAVQGGTQIPTGYLGAIPAIPTSLQTALRGDAFVGQMGIPIITCNSMGPSMVTFQTKDVTSPPHTPANPMPATLQFKYDTDHPTLGMWGAGVGVYQYYGSADVGPGGAVIPSNFTSLLHIRAFGASALFAPPGEHGCPNMVTKWGSDICNPQHEYGPSTDAKSLVGTAFNTDYTYSYDPVFLAQGDHAWPYRTEVDAYDLTKLPATNYWLPTPYTHFPLPFDKTYWPGLQFPAGVTLDPVRNLIFVSVIADDNGTGDCNASGCAPLIHVFRVGSPPPPPPPPPSTTIQIGFGQLGNITICLADATGKLHCDKGTAWLALHPR